jgi:hypothetical protein
MQFLARFEAHCLAGRNAHLGAGPGISAYASFAGADAENAKSAQFDALSGGKGLFQALEDRIHRSFCLGARQTRALDYMMDDVLLNQWGNLVGATELTVLRPATVILQNLMRYVEERPSGRAGFSRKPGGNNASGSPFRWM